MRSIKGGWLIERNLGGVSRELRLVLDVEGSQNGRSGEALPKIKRNDKDEYKNVTVVLAQEIKLGEALDT